MSSKRSLQTAFGLLLGLLMAIQPSAVPAQVAAVQPARGPGSLVGIWRVDGYVSTRRPPSERLIVDDTGAPPPMQPWAKELYAKRIKASEDGNPFPSTTAYCLPGGMPQMMRSANYPIQILETPGQVTMIFEEQHAFRLIYLDQKHPDDIEYGYFGHSVGHWEGDTLVVDTIGLTDRLTIDLLGMPQSEAMHIVERIRRTAPDKFENVLTIDDPKVFTRPWQLTRTYTLKPQERVREDICENNRNTPDGGSMTFQPAGSGGQK